MAKKQTLSKRKQRAAAQRSGPDLPGGLTKRWAAVAVVAVFALGIIPALVLIQHHEIALYAGAAAPRAAPWTAVRSTPASGPT